MDSEVRKKLSQYFESIDQYQKEIDLTQEFFRSKNIPIDNLDEIYWNHLLTLLNRVDTNSQNNMEIEELEDISEEATLLTNEFENYLSQHREFTLTPFESMLLNIYSQKFLEKGGQTMSKPLVVIGHRLGKGENVKRGVEVAGGEAYIIPGVAADMKVGDVMKEMDADVAISFCGSGGAGAISASTKYGYKAKHHLRTVDAGVTALKEGNTVLGFGFMDTEELGRRIVETWKKMHE